MSVYSRSFLTAKGINSSLSFFGYIATLSFQCIEEAIGPSDIYMDQQVEDIANFSGTPIMSLDEEEDIKVAVQSDVTAQDVEDSISSYYTCSEQARTGINNYKAGYTESTDADLELGDKLLKGRNEKWLVKFKSAHSKYDRIFLAAGNLHFVGSDNLIGMLKSEGFSVKRFSCQ